MSGLAIRKDNCELDFLSLGALVHRLDPGVVPFRKARSFDIHVSGGEYNVAANLSECFGLRTGMATAMVNYGIGELVQNRLREMGVRPFYKWFDHDGARGPNIATVYSDRGHGVRPPVVSYNRSNEAAALLKDAALAGQLLYRLEREYWGSKHTHIGKSLVNKWKLPVTLENNIAFHHTPSRAQDPEKASIVHLADIIAHGMGVGSSGERLVPHLDEAAWENLGLSPSVFKGIIRQAAHQLAPLETFF